MPELTPNPAAEANASFDVVKPGTYRMRVAEITEFVSKAGNQCLKAKLEYVDPSSLVKLDDTPATTPGNLFDNGLIARSDDPKSQGRTRNFVEACGEVWENMTNTDVLLDKEVDVKVVLDTYQGEQSNKVSRYFAVQ